MLSAWSLAFAGGFFWEVPLAPDEAPNAWSLVKLLLSPGFHWRMITAGRTYALGVLAILGAHEMGHYLACRFYAIRATLPFFIPGPPPLGCFGAVIRIRGRIPDRRALFDVAAAGPLAGFAVALPLLTAGLLQAVPGLPPVGEGPVWMLGQPVVVALMGDMLGRDGILKMNSLMGAGWVGMLVTSLNLFPVGQLDGGHVAYAVSRRLHRLLARLTLAGLATMVLFQTFQFQVPAYLVWLAILFWMRDRHPLLLDEQRTLGPVRTGLGLLLLLLFLLSFIPVPFQIIDR